MHKKPFTPPTDEEIAAIERRLRDQIDASCSWEPKPQNDSQLPANPWMTRQAPGIAPKNRLIAVLLKRSLPPRRPSRRSP
jgi:hypothetical protein